VIADWVAMLSGQLEPTVEDQLLKETAAEAEASLEDHPNATQRTLEILGKRFGEKEDGSRWDDVRESVAILVGPATPYLLTWLAVADTDERFQRLAQHAPVQVTTFARVVVGMYGREIRDAAAAYKEFPDDWQLVWRNVYYDHANEAWVLKARLLKYNGDILLIEGSPDSFANLGRYLLEMLTMIDTPAAFRPDALSDLLKSMDDVRGMATPQPSSEEHPGKP
jgi:hypothetical protein